MVNGSTGNALNVDKVILYQPPSLVHEATIATPGTAPAGRVYTRGHCWDSDGSQYRLGQPQPRVDRDMMCAGLRHCEGLQRGTQMASRAAAHPLPHPHLPPAWGTQTCRDSIR